jgi:chromosome segregation ATPase
MTPESHRSSLPKRARGLEEPLDDFDLEQQLAQLERRYAEASMRYRRARDEYHLLSLEPESLEVAIAAARDRHDFARRHCELLLREIDALESRLT